MVADSIFQYLRALCQTKPFVLKTLVRVLGCVCSWHDQLTPI